jgi:hypothetical protein
VSAVPAFLLNVEEEEAEDLAALGVDVNRPMSESEIDAAASEVLGRIAYYAAKLAETNNAEALERERINARYERRRDPIRKRLAELQPVADALAARAQFTGKTKSRIVGNGVIGKRKQQERVTITDEAKALVFARAHCPEAIKEVPAEYSVIHKVIAPVVIAYIKSHEGEQPEGFEHKSEVDVPYAKAEVD